MIGESIQTWMMRWYFNFFPAFRRTGGRITYIASDLLEAHVEVPLNWKTRNYVGTIFGGSIYSAVDPIYMIMFIKLLGPKYVVWDKAASIRFIKPGRSTLTAKFTVPATETNQIKQQLVNGNKLEKAYTVDLYDAEGILCATVEKLLYFRQKKST